MDEEEILRECTERLGISDSDRLNEIKQIASLLTFVSDGLLRLQEERPNEPPPAIEFGARSRARDFWAGPLNA
jgi:hypothetical protein